MLVQQCIQQDFDTAADVASTPELWCLKKIKSKKSLLEFKMAGKCLFEQYRSTALDNASVKKTAKNLAETFCIYIHDMYHFGNGFGIPQHFAKEYDLVF